MSVRGVITRLLPTGGPDVIIECRMCGASIESEYDECPECGGTESCRYRIPN